MKNARRMKRQEILLQKLRAQHAEPNIELWEQYLELEETPLKESMASPGRFYRTHHDGGVFDRSPRLTSEDTTPAINRILSDLPHIQQKILRMTFWDGMTEDEIASVLQISRSTVRYQKHIAIFDLRQKSQPKFPINEGVVSFSAATEPRSQINKLTNESEKK